MNLEGSGKGQESHAGQVREGDSISSKNPAFPIIIMIQDRAFKNQIVCFLVRPPFATICPQVLGEP